MKVSDCSASSAKRGELSGLYARSCMSQMNSWNLLAVGSFA
jgi:hypothetical protein